MTIPSERGDKVEREFDLFVRHHAKALLAYCMRRTSHAEAHDAAAEVFSTAWRRFDDVPDDDAGLYWLFGVARRVLSNQRRGQLRHRRLTRRIGSLADTPVPGPETVVLRNAQDHDVVAALNTLQPRDQELLALIVWDEVPRTQVSKLLGISEQAVHKRYQRALRRLERLLSGTESLEGTTHPLIEEGGAP